MKIHSLALLIFAFFMFSATVFAIPQDTTLSFEVNQGQTASSVQFLSRGNGYNLFLTANEAVLSVKNQTSTVWLKLVGTNLGSPVYGEEMLPEKVHYFIGNDPKKWHRNVSTYAKVRYTEVYPGIDLVYYGVEGDLEYDFVVKPGADPKQIAFQIQGSDHFSLIDGELVLQTGGGELHERAPKIYQKIDGVETRIAGSYAMLANNTVGFQLQSYDHEQPLIIDPVLSFSTYLGGTGFEDVATNIQTDATGAIYVSGDTSSADFPATPHLHNSTDVFVTKLSPQGKRIYSIFLGGTNFDSSRGIAISPARSVYVTGYTYSADFPRVRPIQSTLHGAVDIFVTQLSPNGSSITFSTLLGGSGSLAVGMEQASGITLDRARRIYIFGTTNSRDFPVKNAAQKNYGGGRSDGFFTVLSPAGNSLVFSSFVGKKFADNISDAALHQTRGDVYVTGGIATDASSIHIKPFIAHLSRIPNIPKSGLASKVIPRWEYEDLEALFNLYKEFPKTAGEKLFTRLFPESPVARSENASDPVSAISGARLYVAIETCVTIGTTTPCFDTASIAVLDADLHPLSTIHFGGDIAEINGMAIDRQGGVYITGAASRQPFPLVNPIQGRLRGGATDAFVMRFSPGATQITFSTYLGGNKNDSARGIAVDPRGNIYVCGKTESTNFPRVHAIQGIKKGFSDGFVVKISP